MAADTDRLSEHAPAKVNLYLHLRGQREDGYHLLDSLAIFPAIGDVVHACRAEVLSLTITGPQAEGLSNEPDNLVLRAARGLGPASAALTLEKHLPVASGIGGGSSDAAAALRLLSRMWERQIPDNLPLALGADVPVCLRAPEPMRMQGIGEVLTPVPELPRCGMILVNPRVEVSTGAVFKGVADRNPPAGPPWPDVFEDFDGFVRWLKLNRNDLQPSAEAICPPVTQVLTSLSDAPLARMSGSGATCFALYPSVAAAEAKATELRSAYPDWWIAATNI